MTSDENVTQFQAIKKSRGLFMNKYHLVLGVIREENIIPHCMIIYLIPITQECKNTC